MTGLGLSVCLSFLAMISDIRERKIPNTLLGVALLSGLTAYLFTTDWIGLINGIFTMVISFLLLFPIYFANGLGAGDVKLFCVIGFLTGFSIWFSILFWSAAWGGIFSVISLLVSKSKKRKSSWENFKHSMRSVFILRRRPDLDESKSITLPYAVPVFLGICTVIIFGALL